MIPIKIKLVTKIEIKKRTSPGSLFLSKQPVVLMDN